MNDEMWTLDQALEHIMIAERCSKRQARAKLRDAVRRGQIPSYDDNSERIDAETGLERIGWGPQ